MLRRVLAPLQRMIGRAHGAFGKASAAGLAKTFDLHRDRSVVRAMGRPRADLLWLRQSATEIADTWSAARFCIDLLRGSADLRDRFPRALSAGRDGDFARWLCGGDHAFGLDDVARGHVRDAFDLDLSSRPRQGYLDRPDVRSAVPYGFLPPSRLAMAGWLLRHATGELGVRREEVWWFLMETAEDPARELVRTYLFTPEWQTLFPDGLTVFGRERFSRWLQQRLACDEPWLEPRSWPVELTPAEQIRLSYRSERSWQSAHPAPFDSPGSARRLLDWLRSPAAPLTDELRAWCGARAGDALYDELSRPGLNIVGHFCYPSGLQVSAAGIVGSLAAIRLPCSVRDVRTGARDLPRHVRFGGLEIHDTTLLHVQPEPFFETGFEKADLAPRWPRTHRVAFWYWELEKVPQEWRKAAAAVDEVWTATEFVARGVRAVADAPVYTMLPGLAPFQVPPLPRSHFGMAEEGRYTFVFVFHLASVMKRKNPLGLIEAFRMAFDPGEPAELVIKLSFADDFPGELRELFHAAAGANIRIIHALYSHEETLALVQACDAYVSLHRSEGLGLTMAEAMLLGKPVIATGYSGNMDFMDERTSLLVNYDLVDVGENATPYDPTAFWAEPSPIHAARLMRRVYENREWSTGLGQEAAAAARRIFSPEAAGERMAGRLREIARERRGPAASLPEA